jgi:uncharacterized protein YcfJ
MAMNPRKDDALRNNPDSNPDPITGAPGSHPIGTGVGAAGGGAAGAAVGAAIGAGMTGPAAPIGAAIGAVVGAVAGGLAGKGAAEAVNPTNEDAFWRENYATRPYYESGYTYDEDYRPAYEYGWMSRSEHAGTAFHEVEPHLQSGWTAAKTNSRLGWDKAKHAVRDAWDRIDSSRDQGSTLGNNSAYPGRGEKRSFEGGSLNSGGGMGSVTTDEYDTFASNYRGRYTGRSFDDVEMDLRRDWDSSHRGDATRAWEKVKDNVRRAWHKVERAMPGDFDRDGR